MDLKTAKIGFIGAGNIAKAVGGGLIKSGVVAASNVYVSAPSDRSLGDWKSWGANTTHSNGEVVIAADVILLCMKPYQLDDAFKSVNISIPSSKLFVSTLSGTPLSTLAYKLKAIQENFRVMRAMPNTPVLVGAGCTVLTAHGTATKNDIELVKEIFQSVGKCEMVAEHLFSPVVGVAGSSPAFIYVLIEAMADAGVKGGLTRDLAQTLSAQAVMGAAKMVLETGQHPGQLKDAVCSPGGTTIAGIAALEKNGLRAAIMSAVEASTARSDEMTKMYQ